MFGQDGGVGTERFRSLGNISNDGVFGWELDFDLAGAKVFIDSWDVTGDGRGGIKVDPFWGFAGITVPLSREGESVQGSFEAVAGEGDFT